MRESCSLHTVEQWEELKKGAQASDGLVVFKMSPICSISHAAEREFNAWVEQIPEEANLICATIDVIEARALSQHIAKELGVPHESPQVLWLTPESQVKWHVSHYSIAMDHLNSQL